jgi:predicted deacetylase
VREFQGGAATEFPGLDEEATVACLDAGRRVLEHAGVPPRGFVAPGYAYTPALRGHLRDRFEWWATLMRVRPREHAALAPALALGTSSALKRTTSPALLRAGAALSGRLLRLDLHPADFEHSSHVRALEGVLRRAHRRTAVTYDEL